MRTFLTLILFPLLFACGSNNFSGSESAKKSAGSSRVPAGEETSENTKHDQHKSDLVQKGKPILADEAWQAAGVYRVFIKLPGVLKNTPGRHKTICKIGSKRR